MIIICEPQCKGFSHEQVNSGFVRGFLLAYPQEKILFFADSTHFQSVKKILENNNISTNNIEHRLIKFNEKNIYSMGGIIRYYFLLKRILKDVILVNSDKIFFLSNNSIILYVIKKLKQSNKFRNIFCTFVLHGELEDIANIKYKQSYIPTISYGVRKGNIGIIFNKILHNPDKLLLFIFKKIMWPVLYLYSQYTLIFKRFFRVKRIMMWQHSNSYHYIALSPHVVKNAKEFIDTEYLNLYTVIMPVVFAKPQLPANNINIKFAIFGYGDPCQMNKMLTLLNSKPIKKSYEIRIISMDSRGTEGFQNITRTSEGQTLTRKKMEFLSKDIDVFINLYDITRHKLGCSGSIFEALSYLKPILHLSNDGYNYFNNSNKPIGFRCEDMDEFVYKMRDMIENYPSYKNNLNIFRDNMLQYRNKFDIENNLDKLRLSFTFN